MTSRSYRYFKEKNPIKILNREHKRRVHNLLKPENPHKKPRKIYDLRTGKEFKL